MTDKVLLVDYGGVLTGSIGHSFAAFETDHALETGAIYRVLSQVYGENGGLIGQFERGEVSKEQFEETLADLLARDGRPVDADGLIARLFTFAVDEGGMWDVVSAARAAGVRTCLLSNSWGTDWYPYDRLNDVFDELVISGEVGLRKPDPAIYELTLERLGGPAPEECLFVDDIEHNVEAARAFGMSAVHYRESEQAISEILAALDGAPQ